MRKRSLLAGLAGLLLALAPAGPVSAQKQGGITQVDMSRFPTVTLTLSAPDAALTSADVQVVENGAEVTEFVVTPLIESSQQIEVVLAIDTSLSMTGGPIRSAVAAATSFVNNLPDGSRVGLLTFASKPRIVTPVSPDHAGVLAALEEPPATTSGTALYDAVV
ncbi:MAG: VWA domain-containing protein, partial [Actinobacteria bacterium]|nr:VWA domain-containing protein [Actinomycetota bacterium]